MKEFKGTPGKWITSDVMNFSDTLICYKAVLKVNSACDDLSRALTDE